MRIMTHSGQNVTVYCLSGEPMFFEIEKRVIPTGTSFYNNKKDATFKDFTNNNDAQSILFQHFFTLWYFILTLKT